MKSLQIIFLQACLLIMAACGPKGPRWNIANNYLTLTFEVCCTSN